MTKGKKKGNTELDSDSSQEFQLNSSKLTLTSIY